jgi:DSF synthase
MLNNKTPIDMESEFEQKKSFYRILSQQYEQFETHFEPKYQALWCVFKPESVPVFTTTLLKNIRSAQDAIASIYHTEKYAPQFIIWTSRNPNYFSLGLDVAHIVQLIQEHDQIGLNDYLQLCIDVFYINLMKLDIKPTITISLLRGRAYGGGFEAALSSDIIFAEAGAKCGFPEARYNLLPSLGTLSMLMRRLNNFQVVTHLFEGKNLPLEKLHEIGLIEEIVPQGQGTKAIYEFINRIRANHRVYAHLYTERSKSIMISYDELDEFRKLWLDTALNLSSKYLRKLHKLSAAQKLVINKA